MVITSFVLALLPPALPLPPCPEQGSRCSARTALTAAPKHKENGAAALRSWDKIQDPESNKNAAI